MKLSIPKGTSAFASGTTHAGSEWSVFCGDASETLSKLPAESIDCAITSPPYYSQRDYNVEGQIGLERHFDEYVQRLVDTMEEIRRCLAPRGVLFLNLGDTYYSGKGQPKGDDPKNSARRFGLRPVDASLSGVQRKTALGIPWRVALAMIGRQWVLRSPVVWQRDGSIPEPTAKDRPWRTYEMVFIFAKSRHYYFERGGLDREEEDIWNISSRRKNNGGLHSAAFPDEFVEKCLRLGCPSDGVVLDPFAGTGTVVRVALQSGRSAIGIDLSSEFCQYMALHLKKV